MKHKTFEVPAIGCQACVQAIKSELQTLPGIVRVDGSAATRQIEVEFDAPASWEGIAAALKAIDYPPAAS